MNAKIPLALSIGALTLALAACNNDRTDNTPTTAATGTPDTAMDRANDGTTGTMANDGTMGDNAADMGMANNTDPNMPGNTDADRSSTMGMAGSDTDRPGANASGGPTTQAAALQTVMEVDQHEIAAADQAQGKKLDADVKAYADTLKKDHTKNLAATRALMGDTGGTGNGTGTDSGSGTAGTGADNGTTAAGNATGSGDSAMGGSAMGGSTASNADLAAMKSKHEAERKQLASLDGDAYQTAWLDAMVKGHTEALGKLDNQLIPAATDGKVKTHLTDTRSTIARHLETAKQLRSAR